MKHCLCLTRCTHGVCVRRPPLPTWAGNPRNMQSIGSDHLSHCSREQRRMPTLACRQPLCGNPRFVCLRALTSPFGIPLFEPPSIALPFPSLHKAILVWQYPSPRHADDACPPLFMLLSFLPAACALPLMFPAVHHCFRPLLMSDVALAVWHLETDCESQSTTGVLDVGQLSTL